MSDSTGTGTGLGTPERPAGGHSVEGRKPGLLKRPTTFYKQVVAELRKVIWPTRRELLTYTSVVLVFVMFMVVVVSIFDFAFSQGVEAVFGA